jgi:phosphatidylglycerophosphate synthase
LLACLLAGALFASTSQIVEQSSVPWRLNWELVWPIAWRVIWAVAGLLVLLRGLCNVLDGMVAVARGTASRVGELWNELPDRLSDAAMLVGLGYALGGSSALGWAAALAAVLTAYVRAQCRALGVPQDFGGPMAKPTRLILVGVSGIAMSLLPQQWTLGWAGRWLGELPLGGMTLDPTAGLPAFVLLIVLVGSLLTAWRRVRRAARFLRREFLPERRDE